MPAVCVINLINEINAVSLQTPTFFEPLPSANSSLLLPHAQPNLALFALRRRRNSSKSTSVFLSPSSLASRCLLILGCTHKISPPSCFKRQLPPVRVIQGFFPFRNVIGPLNCLEKLTKCMQGPHLECSTKGFWLPQVLFSLMRSPPWGPFQGFGSTAPYLSFNE